MKFCVTIAAFLFAAVSAVCGNGQDIVLVYTEKNREAGTVKGAFLSREDYGEMRSHKKEVGFRRVLELASRHFEAKKEIDVLGMVRAVDRWKFREATIRAINPHWTRGKREIKSFDAKWPEFFYVVDFFALDKRGDSIATESVVVLATGKVIEIKNHVMTEVEKSTAEQRCGRFDQW